jgi:hypothetical protein
MALRLASPVPPENRRIPSNAFDGFGMILPLPFERRGKNVIERSCGVLSVPMRIVVQLCLPFS